MLFFPLVVFYGLTVTNKLDIIYPTTIDYQRLGREATTPQKPKAQKQKEPMTHTFEQPSMAVLR